MEELEGWNQDILQGILFSLLEADLNGYVGSISRGFQGVHGGRYGHGKVNVEKKSILDFPYRKSNRKICLDHKIILGENLTTENRVL